MTKRKFRSQQSDPIDSNQESQPNPIVQIQEAPNHTAQPQNIATPNVVGTQDLEGEGEEDAEERVEELGGECNTSNLRSEVWKHFSRQLIDGKMMAICMDCKNT